MLIKMIDEKSLQQIHQMIDENKIYFDVEAEMDISKQGYNWSKKFIKECLRKGKVYSGKEIYPEDDRRHERFYCIHKYSLISSKLIIIGFLIKDNLLIIHISPLNKGSKEGKTYYLS